MREKEEALRRKKKELAQKTDQRRRRGEREGHRLLQVQSGKGLPEKAWQHSPEFRQETETAVATRSKLTATQNIQAFVAENAGPADVAPVAEVPAVATAAAAVPGSAVPVAAAASTVPPTSDGTRANDLQMLQRLLTLADSLAVQRSDLVIGQRQSLAEAFFRDQRALAPRSVPV